MHQLGHAIRDSVIFVGRRRASTIIIEAVRSSIVIVAPTRSSLECGEIFFPEGLKPKRLIRKHDLRYLVIRAWRLRGGKGARPPNYDLFYRPRLP